MRACTRRVKKLFSTRLMYGERKSVCPAQTLLIYVCPSNLADTHLHTHTDCSAEPTSHTSHTSNLDQHALGWLKIAQWSHCGLPLCEVGWDVIKTLGVISPPPLHPPTQWLPVSHATSPLGTTDPLLLIISHRNITLHMHKRCVQDFFLFYIQLCDFIHKSENVMVSLGGN